MRRLLLTVLLLLASTAWAAPIDDATTANARGDYAAELQITRTLAPLGISWAQYLIGRSYERGNGVSKSDTEAAKWFKLAALQGYADAQYRLGFFYQWGYGINGDVVEAAKWYRLSATQGNTEAQRALGYLYDRGRGVPQDSRDAIYWTQMAASRGDSLDQYILGGMYFRSKEYLAAVEMFELSARQGNVFSAEKLAHMYYEGNGVEKDFAASARWFHQLAVGAEKRRDPWPHYFLGLMHQKGQGAIQDFQEAAHLYRLSARLGNGKAMQSLGSMHQKGEGIAQNLVRAHMWLNLASSLGVSEAASERELVSKKMTPNQITRAQVLARECQARNFKSCE